MDQQSQKRKYHILTIAQKIEFVVQKTLIHISRTLNTYVLAKRGGIVSNTPLPNKRHKQTSLERAD